VHSISNDSVLESFAAFDRSNRAGALAWLEQHRDAVCRDVFDLFHRAAELGHSEAKFNLGVMYRDGIGVDRSIEKAVEFLRSAAELGHSEAQQQLPSAIETLQMILAAVEKSESSGTLDLSALDAVVCDQVLQRVNAPKIKRVVISNSPMSELPPSFDRLREITALEISDSSIPLRDSLCALKLERLAIRGLRAIVMVLLFG
jgi:TPR repeat protein